MISWHWQIVSGLVLFVDKPINETSLQHRIYFGRALPNWGVVVSHQGNRRGAATLVTQESHPFRGESMSNGSSTERRADIFVIIVEFENQFEAIKNLKCINTADKC